MQAQSLANGAEGRNSTGQSAMDWHEEVNRAVSDLRRRIFRGELLEPCADKLCAVVRTERIANSVGRSSGQMTPRRTANLNPKGGGDKSMTVKRGASEAVYGAAPQRLGDTAKARLPEPQCPVAEKRTLVGSTPEHRRHRQP
jgi:hypothetical protein